MNVKITGATDSELDVIVEGEGHTLLNLLRDMLLENENVVLASYVIEHPMGAIPHLTLKTDGKNPMEMLIGVSSRMASLLEEFGQKFTRSIESQK